MRSSDKIFFQSGDTFSVSCSNNSILLRKSFWVKVYFIFYYPHSVSLMLCRGEYLIVTIEAKFERKTAERCPAFWETKISFYFNGSSLFPGHILFTTITNIFFHLLLKSFLKYTVYSATPNKLPSVN